MLPRDTTLGCGGRPAECQEGQESGRGPCPGCPHSSDAPALWASAFPLVAAPRSEWMSENHGAFSCLQVQKPWAEAGRVKESASLVNSAEQSPGQPSLQGLEEPSRTGRGQ